jgi:hypothetical protein
LALYVYPGQIRRRRKQPAKQVEKISVGELRSKISDHQRSWRYEDGPWKEPGHLCWWPLIFKKNFLISVLSDLSVLVTTRPIHHLQVSCLPRPALLVVVLLAHTNRLLKICKNSFLFQFISRRHQSDLHLSSMPSQ